MNEQQVNMLRAILAGYDDSAGWDYWHFGRSLDIPGIGKVSVIKNDTPNDDSGLPAVIIFKVEFNGEFLYFRKSGYVDSYDYDVNWTGEFRQVKPVERKVIDFE